PAITAISLHDALPIYRQWENLRSFAARSQDVETTCGAGTPTFEGFRAWHTMAQDGNFSRGLGFAPLAVLSPRPRLASVLSSGKEDRKSTRLNSSHVSI